nr:DUF305 domain-containing protein [Nocardia carnea]
MNRNASLEPVGPRGAVVGSCPRNPALALHDRHHQGGIEMAAAAERSAVPAVRTRSLSMVNGQQQEIASMSVLLHQQGGQVLPYP